MILKLKSQGREKQLARVVPAQSAAPKALRGRRASPIIIPIISPEVVILGRGGRGRGKQIASEASVAQASVAQVESPAPAVVVQLRRGRSKQTQQ